MPSSDDETKINDEVDFNQDQAPASFRGIRGKKTNPAQKFHHSLAMQTKKLKERTKANRAACKLTKNFLEELSIIPMVTHERGTANKSQTSQISQLEEVHKEQSEAESEKKPPTQEPAKLA